MKNILRYLNCIVFLSDISCCSIKVLCRIKDVVLPTSVDNHDSGYLGMALYIQAHLGHYHINF